MEDLDSQGSLYIVHILLTRNRVVKTNRRKHYGG